MEFEFNKELVALDVIDIPRIGNFAISAEGEGGNAYFIVIKTELGKSYIATCGPVLPEIEEIPENFNVNLTKIDYNEKKLVKIISMFLNDRMKGIYRAELIDSNKALDEFRDLGQYMKEKFKEEENGKE